MRLSRENYVSLAEVRRRRCGLRVAESLVARCLLAALVSLPATVAAANGSSGAGGESSIAVVLRACADADCARRATEEYKIDPSEFLALADGYPRTLTSAEAPDLGAGVFLVTLGVCRSDPKLSLTEKAHYPEIASRRVKVPAAANECVARKRAAGGPLRKDPRFRLVCGYECNVDLLNTSEGRTSVLSVNSETADRMWVADNGPLLELTWNCGTSCNGTYFVDPVIGWASPAFSSVLAADTAKRILVRINDDGQGLLVRPIFDYRLRPAFVIKLHWGTDAATSVESCKFLPGNKLRVYYFNGRLGKRIREIVDLPPDPPAK